MKKGIQSWKNLIKFVLYYFSIGGLLRTLFVPWHRDKYESQSPGLWKYFEIAGFSLITRVIGFIARVVTIAIGLVCLVFVILLFPIFALVPIIIKFENLVRNGSLGREWAYPITYMLNKHGRDMRKMTEVLVIDHDQSIAQIERILSRKTQQNVLVIGSQGIGKTTRLGHLARRMYRDLSSPALNGKRLVQLFPEEMEASEIEMCIKEAVRAKNVVLVIEDIERFNIVGILEPYFDNNHFQMVLTTDYGSYHEQYKNHANLNRVSEVIEFKVPDNEITQLYLRDWALMSNESKRFSDEVLVSVIELTNKLIMNTHQPEKSIDLMEELSSLAGKEITIADVEEVMSQKTGIPLGTLQSDEKEKLIHLEDVLNKHVIGQEPAIKAIASSLKRSRAGVVDSPKPIGSFLFLGTTGVGKTHTAKMLAQYYFGAQDAMTRFDMSEFRELDSMSRFIERLAASVEDRPYSLVFFDEIEKSHADILNLFLQILDEGFLTTTTGRTITFRNTIIICTSNAGADYLMANDVQSQEALINHIVKEGILRPEFINRYDVTVLYQPLDRDAITQVAHIALHRLDNRLHKKQDLRIMITDDLIARLARKGHDLKFGLRPLNRIIQDDIETQIADRLLADEIPENRLIPIQLHD